MPINLEGVELLKADLRANAKNYQQSTFGHITECGTVQCMAGFCHLREVGPDAYTKAIREWINVEDLCLTSGIKQLGIERNEFVPPLFDSAVAWPDDLYHAYRDAKTDDERVEVACAALDRLNNDGSIQERE